MKPFIYPFLSFLLAFVFLMPAGVHADRLEEILDRQTLRVGVSLITPWVLKDKEGELIGFEIDVAKRIAQDMGANAEFTVYAWPDLIPALNRNEIDVIIAGMSITPTRALQINFSRPYAESGVALATNTAMTKDIQDLRELNSPKIVVTAAAKTLGSDVAKMLFDKADLQIVASDTDAAQKLLDGKAHAYVGSVVETASLALRHPDKIDKPLDKPLLASVSGMGVKRGEQELLNFLDAWVSARTADKWLSATHRYWFKSLEWRDKVAD
jgi:polar amino acid transport system substrate-binding protein